MISFVIPEILDKSWNEFRLVYKASKWQIIFNTNDLQKTEISLFSFE